mgnify:CR=1 FL=1
MAFLDNSGDIILDAVLTDLGRKRLAEGSFSITKFAFGDEEINYALYNGTHASGSSYYDLDILQTPILEAFTSDQSLMKSRLVSLTRNNILYMPVFRLNDKYDECKPDATLGGFVLMADATTFNVDNNFSSTAPLAGYLYGPRGGQSTVTTHICVDQGIDSTAGGMSVASDLDRALQETSYLVKLDSRLLELDAFVGANDGQTPSIAPSYLDDDAIATYHIVANRADTSGMILGPRTKFSPRRRDELGPGRTSNEIAVIKQTEVFDGPLGTVLRLVPRTTNAIQQSVSLFNELGSTSAASLSFRGGTIATGYKFIDTVINVTGVTTGFSIDIPIRILKGISFS